MFMNSRQAKALALTFFMGMAGKIADVAAATPNAQTQTAESYSVLIGFERDRLKAEYLSDLIQRRRPALGLLENDKPGFYYGKMQVLGATQDGVRGFCVKISGLDYNNMRYLYDLMKKFWDAKDIQATFSSSGDVWVSDSKGRQVPLRELQKPMAENRTYGIQAGAFTKYENARARLAKVRSINPNFVIVQIGGMYKIRVIGLSKNQAIATFRATQSGIGEAVFVIDGQAIASSEKVFLQHDNVGR